MPLPLLAAPLGLAVAPSLGAAGGGLGAAGLGTAGLGGFFGGAAGAAGAGAGAGQGIEILLSIISALGGLESPTPPPIPPTPNALRPSQGPGPNPELLNQIIGLLQGGGPPQIPSLGSLIGGRGAGRRG